jgi:hypothetical protein
MRLWDTSGFEHPASAVAPSGHTGGAGWECRRRPMNGGAMHAKKIKRQPPLPDGGEQMTLGFLVGVLALGFVLYLIFAITSGAQGRAALAKAQEAQEEEDRKEARFKAQIVEFEKELSVDWPVYHVSRSYWAHRSYLLMSRDQARLGRVTAKGRDQMAVEWEPVIELSSVVSVELQQSETTIMRLETTGTTKKSGSLGRAAVGGVLLGGAGAIVGAASAGSKTAATTTSTTQTSKGPTYLVIGTTDLEHPMHKVQMNSRSEGEKWLHRIRGGLALLSDR